MNESLKPLQYLDSKEKFLKYAYIALKDNFTSEEEFSFFFESIETAEEKDEFLRLASFYLFLVKSGKWVTDVDGSVEVVGYLNETYQYIGIFSLIEALNENRYMDFHDFLVSRKTRVGFPINSKEELESWYQKYKKEAGSIQYAIKFFKSLSESTRKELTGGLKFKKIETATEDSTSTRRKSILDRLRSYRRPSIEDLAKYLYRMRSKFVHESRLILNMCDTTVIGRSALRDDEIAICDISIRLLMKCFEEGLILHFKKTQTTKDC